MTYRHPDLLERVPVAAGTPIQDGRMVAVSRTSLPADLANALEANKCLTARIRQLEKRLSSQLGESVWSESGLGAPVDIDQLQRRINLLEENSPREPDVLAVALLGLQRRT
ncbi:hypothetical protein [Streptomyces sp. RerS4]|uniref:hypothetical protein n=1 Tax=Streptomyces sp. RerS4 TaxID=2942449 RepID=UPI00201BA984|nr:hypothetical protein [Streptomyces sp. RerS4]UQW99301.1 hypothetical protein M4D82_01230 [Streptomyces sp. RerS4]